MTKKWLLVLIILLIFGTVGSIELNDDYRGLIPLVFLFITYWKLERDRKVSVGMSKVQGGRKGVENISRKSGKVSSLYESSSQGTTHPQVSPVQGEYKGEPHIENVVESIKICNKQNEQYLVDIEARLDMVISVMFHILNNLSKHVKGEAWDTVLYPVYKLHSQSEDDNFDKLFSDMDIDIEIIAHKTKSDEISVDVEGTAPALCAGVYYLARQIFKDDPLTYLMYMVESVKENE